MGIYRVYMGTMERKWKLLLGNQCLRFRVSIGAFLNIWDPNTPAATDSGGLCFSDLQFSLGMSCVGTVMGSWTNGP